MAQFVLQALIGRMTLALDFGRIAADHNWTGGPVDEVVRHTAEERPTHLSHATGTSDYHRGSDLFGNLTDDLTRFAARSAKTAWYLAKART